MLTDGIPFLTRGFFCDHEDLQGEIFEVRRKAFPTVFGRCESRES